MVYEDLVIILLGAFFCAGIILTIQNIDPSEPVGILDFILGGKDLKLKALSLIVTILFPIVAGIFLSFISTNKMIVSPASTAMGAFLTVSSAFFRPSIIAPPIKTNLNLARVVYIGFVISYMLLGFLGSLIFIFLLNLASLREFLINNYMSFVTWLFLFTAVKLYTLIKNRQIKHAVVVQEGTHSLTHFQDTVRTELVNIIGSSIEKVLTGEYNKSYRNLDKDLKEHIENELNESIQLMKIAYNQTLQREQRRKSYYTYKFAKQTHPIDIPKKLYNSFINKYNLDNFMDNYIRKYTPIHEPYRVKYDYTKIKQKYPHYFS